MEISQFSKLMVVPFMAYQLDKKMFQCILLNLVVPSINSTDDRLGCITFEFSLMLTDGNMVIMVACYQTVEL